MRDTGLHRLARPFFSRGLRLTFTETTTIPLPLACLAVGLLLLLAGWFLVPALTGLPWRPTDPDRIRRALAMARIAPGETVYDLGSGDGRVVILAASEFGARAVGVEWSPLQFWWSWARVRKVAARDRIALRWANCFETDLRAADIVTAYMTSAQAGLLRRTLERGARPGIRVVTIAFELAGFQPDDFDPKGLIYVYRWPPRRGDLASYLAGVGSDRSGTGAPGPGGQA